MPKRCPSKARRGSYRVANNIVELPVRTANVKKKKKKKKKKKGKKKTFLTEMSPLQNVTSAIEDKVFK